MSKSTTSFEYIHSAGPSCTHDYLLSTVVHSLGSLPGKARVLDLGCGNGSLTSAWSRPGWETHGADTSESGITLAGKAYPHIQFRYFDAEEDQIVSHYGEQAFDAIVCTEVIEHVFAPRDLARNVFRLLRPGGVFVVSTPYHGYVKNLAIATAGKMDTHFTALWDGGHIKFWSKKTLSALLHEVGFRRIEFRGAGRVPYMWKSMVLKAVRPI